MIWIRGALSGEGGDSDGASEILARPCLCTAVGEAGRFASFVAFHSKVTAGTVIIWSLTLVLFGSERFLLPHSGNGYYLTKGGRGPSLSCLEDGALSRRLL